MRESTPIISSIVIHAGLALAAFNMPNLMDYVNQRDQQPPIYTMELVPSQKPKPIALQKPRPKKAAPKKKTLAKVKPKSFYQQPKKAKNLLTQKQKSPVKVVEASRPSKDDKAKLPEKFIPLPAKEGTTAGRSTSKSGLKQANAKKKNKGQQSGINEIADGRLLRQSGGNQPPFYPVADRIRKKSGKVVVMGFVDRNGNVSRVHVDESSGTPRMESNSIQAFSKYKFQKGQEGWVKMPFEFTLGGEARVISVRNSRLLRSIQ